MDRDMNAIRDIMIAVKNSNKSISSVDGMPDETFKYNAALLIEAGLALGSSSQSTRSNTQVPAHAILSRLTWEGHDFIDSIKDETVWEKVKARILKPTGSWTFGILTELIKHELKNSLGLTG